ncbi:glycosyltransferase family 2 protein [Megalodesulfovibrio paquesii]
MPEALTLISLLLLAYTLVGYPLLMRMLARWRPLPTYKDATPHPVSVVLCVRDEARRIAARLDNLLAMDVPEGCLEIIVISDGSTDETDAIVRSYSSRGVILARQEPAAGKAAALNTGIALASHEFLLLCDARQRFAPDVARRLMAWFGDASVGAVSGRLVIQPANARQASGAASAVGSYWNIEARLRADEAASGSVVGATGAIYMVRKSHVSPLPAGTILDDVLVPMRIALQGRRVLFDATAIAVDEKPIHDRGELARKVRTLYGNLQLWTLAPMLFSPWRNPLWFRFVSHKLLRLFLPWFLALSLTASLVGHGWLFAFGMMQLFTWIAAALAWRTGATSTPWRALSGFLLLNAAVVLAWKHWLFGGGSLWQQASSHDQTCNTVSR